MGVRRNKVLSGRIAAIVLLACVCALLSSCVRDDGLHFRDYIADVGVTGLELLLNRYESPAERWYVSYSVNGTDGEWVEEKEVAPFDSRDYKIFSSINGLENLYICLGDDVSPETAKKILENIPGAQSVSFAYCPTADFSVLEDHRGFNDVSFTNHCNLTTLPVIDARNLGLSGCSNIPWEIVSQMGNVESIRYGGKETLDYEAFAMMAKMSSLKTLVYNAVPYDNWNWGGDGSDYTQPPFRIESLEDVEDWVYQSIDRASIEVFLGDGERVLILLPFLETNPGA